jgi:hypothetical protein
MRKLILNILSFFIFFQAIAQDTIQYETIQFGSEKCYARALHVTKNELYIGASDGTFVMLNLKNKNLEKYNSPAGFSEIRDIEQIGNKLFLMESSDSSEVYIFDRKNKTFTKTELPRKDVFLDGLVVSKEKIYAIGDPQDNLVQFYCFSNNLWSDSSSYFQNLGINPYFFSASGTTFLAKNKTFHLISGGKNTHYTHFDLLFTKPISKQIPMLKGETSGPYSLAIHPKKMNNMVIVGGDYKRQNYNDSSALLSVDFGTNWQFPKTKTGGYRSCVTFVSKNTFISCGPTGSDISYDGGLNWKPFISGKFHACVVSKKYEIISSNNGKVIMVKR